MRHNAEEASRQFGMFPKGSHVVVGFSGGADSVALLAFLYEKQQEWELTLTACHINHQLRGQEAQRDEDFCRAFCAQRGIDLVVFREDIARGAREAGQSIEEYARNVRYERFSQLARPNNARIATAHHLNDLVETQLLHLIRGTGLRGMIGMMPVRENIVRPLLYCTRKEIESYCREKGLCYVIDSTNEDDFYTRNQIRHHLIPQMERINPSFLHTALRLSRQAMLEEDFLEQQCRVAMDALLLAENQWDRLGFVRLHPAMQRRILSTMVRALPCEYTEKKIREMEEIIRTEGTIQLCADWYLDAAGSVMQLRKRKIMQPFFEMPLKIGENILFSEKKLTVFLKKASKYKNFENNDTEVLKNLIDYDRIRGSLIVRQRKPGDCIQLSGFTKPRSFKKLMNEAKLPVEERARVAVLCDEDGPVWLEGFGVRADAQPDDRTTYFMAIQVIKE